MSPDMTNWGSWGGGQDKKMQLGSPGQCKLGASTNSSSWPLPRSILSPPFTTCAVQITSVTHDYVIGLLGPELEEVYVWLAAASMLRQHWPALQPPWQQPP